MLCSPVPGRLLIAALLAIPAMLSQDVPVFRQTATLVTVPCVVTDERGRTIRDLKIDDFVLYVNGVRRQIDNLWSEADLPLLIGVINDVSESQKNQIPEKDHAITQLLEQVVHRQDRAFVVEVNDRVMLKSEVSAGTYGLRYRVPSVTGGEPLGVPCGTLSGEHGRKRPVCGGTALWNAVYASAHFKLSGPAAQKALLILSDGNDTGSTHSFSAAMEEVQRNGIVAYAVQYPDSFNSEGASDELYRLTDETGGTLFDLRGADYSQIVSRIVADLRGRYVLGFRPESTGTDATHGSLRVEVNRSGARVRARKEYSGP